MEEMQKLEEEERKQDAIEEVLTVTKQKDMSGFYRHLYRQTMGEEKGQKEVPVVKVEPVSVDAAKTEVEAVGVKTEIEEDFGDEKDRKKLEKVKARTYRTRKAITQILTVKWSRILTGRLLMMRRNC